MRRDVKILLVTTLIAAVAEWGPAARDAVSEMETFRISDVEVRGVRFMSEADVVDQLEVGKEASVWTDKQLWIDRLERHPLVRTAEITRKVPSGLRVTVHERVPVALAPTPILEPIDAEGHRLPLDPSVYRMDLPVIATDLTPARGARLVPEEVRTLAAEVAHLATSDLTFFQNVSSVRYGERETIVVRLSEPRVEFLLPGGASPARLREGLGALSNAMARTPASQPIAIDLRYADQVVVRRGTG